MGDRQKNQLKISEWPNGSTGNLSIVDALTYSAPVINQLAKSHMEGIKKDISSICFKFLRINSTGDVNDLISQQFADMIIRTRYDWKLTEVQTFFNTILDRQDIEGFRVFGNKITALKLSEMVCTYEELRSEAREDLVKKDKKSEPAERLKIASMEEAKVYIDKIFENIKPIKKVCKPTEKNNAYWIVQEYLEEFDRLFNSQQNTCEGIRYVVVGGERHDIDKYLKKRFEENEASEENEYEKY